MAQPALYFIVWQEGKHYVGQCLNADVSSFGATRDEALQNVHEAYALYCEDQRGNPQVLIENPEIISASPEHA